MSMFHSHNIPLPNVSQLAHTDKAYAACAPDLREFYTYTPELAAFHEVIDTKKTAYNDKTRAILCQTLRRQYQNIANNTHALQCIDTLTDSQTFTVCTAHQPLLFTGAFYFIYKIAAAIKLAKELTQAYPEHNFIPIYWIGSEDHDFEELNHCYIFNKKITWDDAQGGAVGNYKTDTLPQVVEHLKAILGTSPEYEPIIANISRAYLGQSNFARATFEFVNDIFQHTNLLILDQNDEHLKQICLPIFVDDLLQNNSFRLVNETAQRLTQKGYKIQAAPRPINLFYLLPQQRQRFIFENGQYKILNTDIVIEKNEIETFVQQHIAQISPNVILRPLMQETVLPNVAYLGGGGEIAYWLERKTQFNYYQIPQPVLVRRPSVLFIDKNTSEKLQKHSFGLESWFENVDIIIKQFLSQTHSQDMSLTAEKEQIKTIYTQILAQHSRIAPALSNTVQGQIATVSNLLTTLAEKMQRELKRSEAENVQQISRLKDKLFPNQNLQERNDNFIPLYAKFGYQLIDFLIDNFQPLNPQFHIFSEL